MKWLIPGIWLAAILFAHFRGRVRLPLGRQMLDHSVLLAPVNAFMVLASRVPSTPYLTTSEIAELKVLDDNWQAILAGSKSVKDAMDEVTTQVDRLLKQ